MVGVTHMRVMDRERERTLYEGLLGDIVKWEATTRSYSVTIGRILRSRTLSLTLTASINYNFLSLSLSLSLSLELHRQGGGLQLPLHPTQYLKHQS